MNKHIRLIIIITIIPLIVIFLGIINLIIRVIGLPSIIIIFILVTTLSNKKGLRILGKLLKKGRYYLTKSQIENAKPRNKNDAARKSLKSIDQLTALIQDNITSESLRLEKERVEKELIRGDLLVCVLGTGSSGKTSLTRALLKKIVGKVSPTMGSTEQSAYYRLHLKNLSRGLRIIDTPGILEAGEEGRAREKKSLLIASRADLIIFVIDSDIRSYEMQLIETLSDIGKKMFIALNKCDLLSENEESRLLNLVRNHCIGLISQDNIIATSASPQSIPMVGSHPLQPKPEINQLINRIANVLHQEGEELIADNILLQCRNLDESGKKLLIKQRFLKASNCVDKYIWISSGVILVNPLPGLDLIGTAVVSGRMVMDISEIYGVVITKERAKELAKTVAQILAGLGIIKGGFSLISNSLALNLPTYIIGKTVQSITAAWLTKIAGESFITYFQQDQNWGDGGVQEVVQRHYKLNIRESILRRFVESATNRVIINEEKRSGKKQLPPRQRLQEEEGAWGPENRE